MKRYRLNIFTTAELGTNWNGDYKVLEVMMNKCKRNGVSAVKLQALSPELVKRHRELPWFHDASVEKSNVEEIDRLAKKVGIEWYASITYPNAVDFLEPFVKKWKIRVADNNRFDIIKKCMDTGKDVIITSSRPEVPIRDPKVHYLFGIAQYPTIFGEINFDMLSLEVFEGYSNHCKNPLAILKAARMGSKYIEFHLTNDLGSFAVDNKVSFDYAQMEEFMQWINNRE